MLKKHKLADTSTIESDQLEEYPESSDEQRGHTSTIPLINSDGGSEPEEDAESIEVPHHIVCVHNTNKF